MVGNCFVALKWGEAAGDVGNRSVLVGAPGVIDYVAKSGEKGLDRWM